MQRTWIRVQQSSVQPVQRAGRVQAVPAREGLPRLLPTRQRRSRKEEVCQSYSGGMLLKIGPIPAGTGVHSKWSPFKVSQLEDQLRAGKGAHSSSFWRDRPGSREPRHRQVDNGHRWGISQRDSCCQQLNLTTLFFFFFPNKNEYNTAGYLSF